MTKIDIIDKIDTDMRLTRDPVGSGGIGICTDRVGSYNIYKCECKTILQEAVMHSAKDNQNETRGYV